jgi:hypothetical protein
MTKADRLEMIRAAAEKHEESKLLALGVTAPTRGDVEEEMADLDAFREHQRDLSTDRGYLTSDEG